MIFVCAGMALYMFSNLRILFYSGKIGCTVVNPVLPLYILLHHSETG